MTDVFKRFKSSGIFGVCIAFAVMFVICSFVFADRGFFTFNSIANLLRKTASDGGILALGMTFVMLIGCIDLSVGSTLALSGVFAAMVAPVNPWLAVLAGVLTGFVCGALNGFLVAKMKILPFVATLATMLGIRGLVYIITGKVSVRINDGGAFTAIANKSFFGISMLVIVFFVMIALCAHLSNNTKFGMSLYAVGGNEEAARMMGLRVERVKMLAYIACGVCAGINGVLMASRLNAGQAVAGDGWEMFAIASAALGGVKMTGGVGKFGGTLFGALIVATINTLFNYAGNINTWWQNIIMGALLLVSVMIQSDIFRLPKFVRIKAQSAQG